LGQVTAFIDMEQDFMAVFDRNRWISTKRRENEFRQLRDDEVPLLEGIVRDAFKGFDDGMGPPAGDHG
jgi:hypothetical protein